MDRLLYNKFIAIKQKGHIYFTRTALDDLRLYMDDRIVNYSQLRESDRIIFNHFTLINQSERTRQLKSGLF